VQFQILGPLEVRDGERLLPLGGAKQRGVLALLLIHGNEVVSRQRLIDELWGDEPPRTAANVIQVYVSQLRKALSPAVLLTRGRGYMLRVEPEELDLRRFERLAEQAREAEPAAAAETLREALSLWRGAPLADLHDESFGHVEIARLEELRLSVLELRIDADLAVGRHGEVVGELERLAEEYPLRERLRGQLMLALYRSGRQAEALEVFKKARALLVEQLGIEPSAALKELELAILRHDPRLELDRAAVEIQRRSILVAPQNQQKLDALISLGEALARSRPPRELILASLIAAGDDLSGTAALLLERRDELIARGAAARAAAFTSATSGDDLVRMAREQDVDLLLLDGSPDGLKHLTLQTVLAAAPCDVAILDTRDVAVLTGPVLVPFAGSRHDWAALEMAAWVADAHGVALRLAGVAADLEKGGRDASRLLARASLIVQKITGVAAEPLLVERGEAGLLRAAEDAGLLVVGLPQRWLREGLGPVRLALMRRARPPTLLVRRGLRPGGMAPKESITRFTWTLEPGGR